MADIKNEEEIKVSLIVEDGSCVPSANSYVSLDYADKYMRNMGKTSWFSKSEDERKAYLINATLYIDRTYSVIGWKGRKKYVNPNKRQALCFPRVELFDKDNIEILGIPEELKQAVCEAGFIAVTTSLFTINSASGEVKKKKAETLEIEYFSSGESAKGYISRFSVLDSLLAGFYKTKSDYRRIKRAIHTDLLGEPI